MDDTDGSTVCLILFFVLILVNILFFGFGEAVRTLNEIEIEENAKKRKSKKYARLLRIINEPARYVNTLQFVVTLCNVLLGGWCVNYYKETPEFLITMVIALYIVLTFGILLPKKLAVRFPKQWAYALINPMYFMLNVLLPFTGIVTISVNGILRLFGMKDDNEIADVTEEEIISMVNEGHEQGVFEASEAELITNIFEYADKEAQDIMTHRSNVVGIDGDLVLQDAVHFMLSQKYSRYPVYDENIDKIIGVLHLKDALRIQVKKEEENRSIKEIDGLLRSARFIPLTRNIDDLFKAMQSQKLQMVIVVDEYGQTAGLIAMEDILEEIVGNILDEYDEEDVYIEEKGEDEYIIEGKTPLEDLEERFGLKFDEEEFETLNGFMISKLDRIPGENEEFDIDVDGYNFKILSVENKMIQSVLVTRLKEDVTEAENVQGELEENEET